MPFKDAAKLSCYICLASSFGFTFAFTVYTRIFPPVYGIDHSAFDKTLILSVVCGITGLVYYSRKELNNRQMGGRILIQMALLLLLIPYLLRQWSWVKPGFAGYAVVVVFIIVQHLIWIMVALKLNSGLAKQLNSSIQKRKDRPPPQADEQDDS